MERDYARAGRAAKRKGAVGENEVRDLLREYGYTGAHRNFMSGGAGGGDLADAIPDVHIEVKRTESVSMGAWRRQATAGARPTDLVLIVHRGGHQDWQATGELVDLHYLMQHLPMHPTIATTSPRGHFLAEHKLTTASRRPMVLHNLAGVTLATVLFEDWLKVWAPAPSMERAA